MWCKYTLSLVMAIISSNLPPDIQNIVLVHADTTIHKIEKIAKADLQISDNIAMHGRGDTDMVGVLKELPDAMREFDSKMPLQHVIIITDGYWVDYNLDFGEDGANFRVWVLVVPESTMTLQEREEIIRKLPNWMNVSVLPPLNPWIYYEKEIKKNLY